MLRGGTGTKNFPLILIGKAVDLTRLLIQDSIQDAFLKALPNSFL